ncbi:MAG: PHP domain-containing protein [Peptococcaceae bacterium]|nr:PHP domain-containing protein [Peptococcaceae bacterium]
MIILRIKQSKWFADLHCHTCFSDGSLSSIEIVSLAAARGLRVLAVTDHDSIGMWERTGVWAKGELDGDASLLVLPGVEINTAWAGAEIHVLGYFHPGPFYDVGPWREEDAVEAVQLRAGKIAALEQRLEMLRGKRLERAHAIVDKLRGLGVDILWEHVESLITGTSVGRSHIARALVKCGEVTTAQEAFERYLNAGAAAYVPNYNIQPHEAIQLIHDSGGVPVLAHPKDTASEVIRDWVDAGLAGLEVWHPDHSPSQVDMLLKLTEDLGILATGGSDFHGFGLHAELGEFGVDAERFGRLLAQLDLAKY